MDETNESAEEQHELTEGGSGEQDLTSMTGVMASMPKESLKSLLYLAAGRQDSNVRMINQAILLSHEDLLELNDQIQEKLQQHETVGLVSVDIMYKGGRATQFGTWAEFETHNFREPAPIDAMTLKWDFLFKMPTFAIPQRHTLTVKLLASFNPLHILQAVLSRHPDELGEAEIESAPIICRVDFINHLLADELLNIVEYWVKGRRYPSFITKPRTWIKKNKENLARLIRYSIPGCSGLLSAAVLHDHFRHIDVSLPLSPSLLEYGLLWLLASYFGIHAIRVLSGFIGRSLTDAVDRYGGFSMFEISSGDKNRIEQYKRRNNREVLRFVGSAIVSLVLNVIAAGIAVWIYEC